MRTYAAPCTEVHVEGGARFFCFFFLESVYAGGGRYSGTLVCSQSEREVFFATVREFHMVVHVLGDLGVFLE